MAALSRCAASTCLGRQLCSVPTLRRFASTSNRTLFPSLTDALLARKPSPSPTPSRAGNLAGRSYSTVASKATPPAGNRSRLAIAAGGLSLLALSSLYLLNPNEENLSPTRFIPLKVLAVEHMTKDTSLFKISLPKNLLPDPDQSISKPILSLYVMQPDLQIQRPYTVLDSSSFNADGSGEIHLVVKMYPDGEVSRWMHRLGPGDEIKIRGPTVTWDYAEDTYDEVVFIVGGTGITPAYQTLKHLQGAPSDTSPKVSIIYSSPSPPNILLRDELDKMVFDDPFRVKVKYLVDQMEGVKDGELVLGRVNTKLIEETIGRGGGEKRRVVVVCGPEGMVNAVAGPRARDQTQGPVGGILAELGYTSSQVVKL